MGSSYIVGTHFRGDSCELYCLPFIEGLLYARHSKIDYFQSSECPCKDIFFFTIYPYIIESSEKLIKRLVN